MINRNEVKKQIQSEPAYFPFEWIRSANRLFEQNATAEIKEIFDEYKKIIAISVDVCEEFIKEHPHSDNLIFWESAIKERNNFIRKINDKP